MGILAKFRQRKQIVTEFIDARKLLAMLLNRWWILATFAAIAGIAGYLYTTQQTPVYEATATLSVSSVMQSAEIDRYDSDITDDLVLLYSDMARRQPTLQGVVDALNSGVDWQRLRTQVHAEPVPGTPFIEIRAEAASPALASDIADEVAQQLILQSPNSSVNQAAEEDRPFIQQRLDNLRANIVTGQERLATLEGQIASATMLPAVQLNDVQAEIRSLEELIADWDSTYSNLLLSLNPAQVTNNLSVLEPARASDEPIRPQTMIMTLLAVIVGFVLGLGLILLLEYFNTTLRSSAEAVQTLRIPQLGAISFIKGNEIQDGLLVNQEPFSPVVEEYRLLHSKLSFLYKEQQHKTILVTSPTAGEGKSLTVANLGILMAQAGNRTIILDANLRDPVQHVLFDLPATGGLIELLNAPQTNLDSNLKKTRIDNLLVVTCGDLRSVLPEQLSSNRTTELITALSNAADIVLIDSPETVTVADALALAHQVDGVLFVISAGKTRRNTALQAVGTLQQVNANVIGFVSNSALLRGKTVAPIARKASLSPSTVIKGSAHIEV